MASNKRTGTTIIKIGVANLNRQKNTEGYMTPAYKQKLEARAATKCAELIDAVKNPAQFAEEYMKRARSWVERDGGFCPMAVVVHSNGYVLVTTFENIGPSTQDSLARTLWKMANRPAIEYVLFIADSYVAVCKAPVVNVKAVPGRKEAVICKIMVKADTAIATWVYDRDANNKPVFASNIEFCGIVPDEGAGSVWAGQ